MKRMFWCTGIFILMTVAAQSQQARSRKMSARKTIHPKTVSANKKVSPDSAEKLNATSSYPAKANTNRLSSLKNNYVVTDPILTTLNARANGANIKFNNSGIVGMPKSAYGFANGHISLKTTGAVTSGTQTGSGSVGTGTSQATFGSIGAPMNVNGKSPYAGINMWGNAMNMMITQKDSSMRLQPIKRQ